MISSRNFLKNFSKLWIFIVLEKNHYGENFRDFRKVLMSSTKPLFVQILHVWVIFWDFFWNGTWRRHLGQLTKSSSLCILRLVFSLGQRRGAFWELLRSFLLRQNFIPDSSFQKWKICVFDGRNVPEYNFRLESEGTKNNGFRIGRKGDLIRVDYLQSTQILNFNPFF